MEKKYSALLKNKKQLLFIVFGALLGVIFLVFSSGAKNDVPAESVNDGMKDIISYEEYLEEKITKLCESVNGASDVRVVVTVEGGFERVYAKDGELLTVGSGSVRTPVEICERTPSVRGVGIVCKGANDPVVQKQLTELLSAALGVPSNRIFIANGT